MADIEDIFYKGGAVIGAFIGFAIGFNFGGIGGGLLCAVIGAIVGLMIGVVLLPVFVILHAFGLYLLAIIAFLIIVALLWGVGK